MSRRRKGSSSRTSTLIRSLPCRECQILCFWSRCKILSRFRSSGFSEWPIEQVNFSLHLQTNHRLGIPEVPMYFFSYSVLRQEDMTYWVSTSHFFVYLKGVYSLARLSFKTCFLYILGLVDSVDFNQSLAAHSGYVPVPHTFPISCVLMLQYILLTLGHRCWGKKYHWS